MNKTNLFQEAKKFIEVCYHELGKEDQINQRLLEIHNDINKFGIYEHTYEELSHGAKMAWRNSNRCIGRLYWQSLNVIDKRHLDNEEDIYEALVNHINVGTNDGKIKPTITVFKTKVGENQEIRIWNHQLVRYAGYETEEGMIGDPLSTAFTKACQRLGWEGAKTHYDILPIVIQINNREPKWFNIPNNIVLEVPISHPDYPNFDDLHLQWYAVPIISDMKLEIGGLNYTAAPFNGWYMGTEIGARNFADTTRYNVLPKVASLLNLDTSKNSTLWKDKALIELNIAVIHSFKLKNVTIVDHHSAASQFKQFELQETKCGRSVTGDWTWLIPPLSPASTHIFHSSYKDDKVLPNYLHQEIPY